MIKFIINHNQSYKTYSTIIHHTQFKSIIFEYINIITYNIIMHNQLMINHKYLSRLTTKDHIQTYSLCNNTYFGPVFKAPGVLPRIMTHSAGYLFIRRKKLTILDGQLILKFLWSLCSGQLTCLLSW